MTKVSEVLSEVSAVQVVRKFGVVLDEDIGCDVAHILVGPPQMCCELICLSHMICFSLRDTGQRRHKVARPVDFEPVVTAFLCNCRRSLNTRMFCCCSCSLIFPLLELPRKMKLKACKCEKKGKQKMIAKGMLRADSVGMQHSKQANGYKR